MESDSRLIKRTIQCPYCMNTTSTEMTVLNAFSATNLDLYAVCVVFEERSL